MAQVFTPQVLDWRQMTQSWYQWVLFAIILGTAGIGTFYIIFNVVIRSWIYFKTKPTKDVVSKQATKILDTLQPRLARREKPAPQKVSSFGIYLGDFSNPPTPEQFNLLSRSRFTILDPLKVGIKSAVQQTAIGCDRQYFGRLDLSDAVAGNTEKDAVLQRLAEAIAIVFDDTTFDGIVFAGLDEFFSTAYINDILDFIDDVGIIAYLEVKPPRFLQHESILSHPAVHGIIVCNAVILPNGDHRDYFDMSALQPTLKAFVKESCLRTFNVLALEVYDADVHVSNAILKRGIQWTGFYSAITWAGPSTALTDARKNQPIVEPLGAFEWLKEDQIMKVHADWKENTTVIPGKNSDTSDAWEQVSDMFEYTTALRISSENADTNSERHSVASTAYIAGPSSSHSSATSLSESYRDYKGLGCYPLGVDVTPLAFAEVVQAQIRLQNLNLLHPVDAQKVTALGILYRKFLERYLSTAYPNAVDIHSGVKELSNMASTGRLQVNIGLNPGFKYGSQARFWGVFNFEGDKHDMFISKDAHGIAGLVLHVFLSSKGFTKEKCLEMETALALWSNDIVPGSLPRRFVQDIDLLTPTERLLLLQQMRTNGIQNMVMTKIEELVRDRLIDAPTKAQLGEMDSVGFLNGSISIRQLLEARFHWYNENGVSHPNMEISLAFFEGVEEALVLMLRERRDADLKELGTALESILIKDKMDAWADVLGLAVFCAARKAALDEVYLEVTDRNPLLNDQPDQAAAFAESFALGSRCESYFDVAPGTFGKILSDRFRLHYDHKQPPSWVNGAPDFATAYGGAGIDIDPKGQPKGLPEFQRFTFLSVFAIPALVDIALLTTTGRGLYLSAYMSFDEQNAATTALMASLLLSGATGTWIACGGSYYLISMAFSAMNVFVLSRLIAGLAFTVAGALVGFIVLCGVQGFTPAIIFALYLIAFTSYLILFAALASFQFPGSAFLSGRKLIIFCLPWLLISPVITIWTGHDVIVYLSIFYLVVGFLFLALRHIGGKWVTWYQNIRKTEDAEIRKWYIMTKLAGETKALQAMTDPAALKVARDALLQDILAETKRRPFKKPTQDKLVRELAADWEATNFLLDWYCRYSDVPRPIAYSSSWNIQTKVALQTLCDNQKGIRLHNAFVHWRQAGDEVGCGILYFMVALLDKWVEMLSGVHLLGLSPSLNNQFRVAVGFGLAYYLVGAVLIDVKAQELHAAVAATRPVGIENSKELREHQKQEVQARRHMYIKTLVRYLAWHVWSMAFATTLVFTLSNSLRGMIMFLAYVVAYTGLLWYQYTKIFSGPHALKPMIIAVCVGLPIGIALKKTYPEFEFSGVIALGSATWTAAILCLWSAKLGMPKKIESGVQQGERYHAHVKPWADPEFSQEELKSIFENLDTVPDDARFTVNPREHPGLEVITILHAYQGEGDTGKAFPDVQELVNIAFKAWVSGQIHIELVALSRIGSDIRAISCWTDNNVKIVIGIGKGAELPLNIRSNCRIIAEILLHEVAEGYFEVPHEHAVLAELLVSDTLPQNLKMLLAEEHRHEDVLNWAKREMLKQQCLGIDCDLHWDKLPNSTRELFIKRSMGEACEISQSEYSWLAKTLCKDSSEEFDIHIARCDLALEAAAQALDHAFTEMGCAGPHRVEDDIEGAIPTSIWYHLKRPFSYVYHALGTCIKFFIIALIADPEFQREFDFKLKNRPFIIHLVVGFFMNLVWSYARLAQNFGLALFLFERRPNVKKLWDESKGMTITQRRNRLLIRRIDGETTAFRQNAPLGGFKLFHYKGVHKTEPRSDVQLLKFIATYSIDGELTQKEEYEKGEVTNTFEYDYNHPKGRSFFAQKTKIPSTRRCTAGPRYIEAVNYNSKGLIDSGSYMLNGNLIYFKLYYRKNARHFDELLRGEFNMAHLNCTIEWCAPPRRHSEKENQWIPYTKVLRATFVEGSNTYVSKWSYDHKFHPTITTKLNGNETVTPPMIEHDWLNVLKKPSHGTFFDENPLFHSSFWNNNAVARLLGLATQRFPISTSQARSRVWKAWKKSKDLDGVIVRYLDERLMRRDSVLSPYWRSRDRGNLVAAKKYLRDYTDAIMASADLDDEISGWTPLAIKMTDLWNFGAGGDSIMQTKSQNVGFDTDQTLHVLSSDNGTWPNEGGGVSACRRDVVNSLKSIRWHMICESANDFGLPKHQTEQNVLSLKVIPLWGLDFLTPTHGLFKNRLDSEVDMIRSDATDLDIQREFIPVLSALVKGSRALHLTSADIKQATRAFIKLNDYFTDKRHWSQVWKSDVSKEAWRSLWLSQDIPNTKPSAEWLDTELPTLGHLDTAMELWLRYLFIFSMKVPDKTPAVFQATHHSVSAVYGIICKVKTGCQLQIWDHAIAWRETNMCLSSTLCKLPPFVRNSVLGLMRLTSVMILHHADVILPCADFFNPGWEVEIGTCQGTIEHRNSFKRKIAPVVNGITDAEKFKPVKEILTKQPTVTMLSHLWFCKDLKTAILAADIIVNEWGFKDYQLDVYGSIEKAPIYSNECQELIASKSLRGQVKLCGSADPLKVLEQTWLFLNSSLSEGLPLALGEAALTGAPVVCTDVGASLRVLSDPDDFSRYSAVVAPNDARALARAQIKMLGMLDEWGKYADDAGPSPVMPFAPTTDDVNTITARMYEKSDHRRKLGMMSRDIVQKSFSGERYLREHEQMLWIGKCHKLMDSRILGDISENPIEISNQLRLAAPVNDEVIPRSAAGSLRSASPSPYSRSVSPSMHDAMRSGSRLSEAMRSTSRLSTAPTMNDFSALNLMTTGHRQGQGKGHAQATITALPGFELPEYNYPSSSHSNTAMSTSATRPTTSHSRKSRKSREQNVLPPPLETSSMSIMYKSPFESPFAPPKDQKKVPKRKELRYRNSDVSVINLETVGRFLSPMS